jgi:hypothetical protein
MEVIHKSIQKPSKKTLNFHPQKDAGKTLNKSSKIPTTLRFQGHMLEPFAWHFPGVARFFGNLSFGTFAGRSQGRFWSPPGVFVDPLGAIWPSLLELFWHPANFLSTSTLTKSPPELRNCGTDSKMSCKHFTNT